MKKSVSAGQVQVSQAQAEEMLWVYYKDNKAQLHHSVRDCIGERLLPGIAVVLPAQAFAHFALSPAPIRVGRKNACSLNLMYFRYQYSSGHPLKTRC